MTELSRARYAALFGPTTGDRIRLADTDLLVEITEDRSGGPGLAGDEAVFGGGNVLRESMGQGTPTRADGAPDTVITGVVIVDYWGIIKADIGIRDGRIVAIGKAGNPDTMTGVHPDLVVGPSTEIIAGNGRIVTAGAIDCHVHLSVRRSWKALGGGITTSSRAERARRRAARRHGSDMTPQHTALSIVYTTMTGSATAAQRLLALDPGDVAALTFELSGMCDETADLACKELADLSDPLLDVLAQRHADRERPLFVS